jgi:hypothetical protein
MNHIAIIELEKKLEDELRTVSQAVLRIRKVLEDLADGKALKGDELVAWLGEVYGKLLFGGTLVDESHEHDFTTSDGRRISVKARRDRNSGGSWRRSSGIPRIEGADCPTHLLFIRLDEDYRVREMWLHDWNALLKSERFKSHKVREVHRAYYFEVKEAADAQQKIYPVKKP